MVLRRTVNQSRESDHTMDLSSGHDSRTGPEDFARNEGVRTRAGPDPLVSSPTSIGSGEDVALQHLRDEDDDGEADEAAEESRHQEEAEVHPHRAAGQR